MNLYLLAALSSGLFFALNGLAYKAANKHAFTDPLRLLTIIYLLQLLISLSVFPLAEIYFVPGQETNFVLFVLSFFAASVLVGLSLPGLDASVFMPLFNLQLVFTSVFAFLLLGERFPPVSYLLMGLIVLGGVLISFDESSSLRLGKELLPFVAGLILYGLSDSLGGRLIGSFGAINLRFWMGLGLALLSLILIPFFKVREKMAMNKLLFPFLTAFFGFLALVFLTTGFNYSVALSQALARLSGGYTLVIILILARFFPKFLEKHSLKVYAVRLVGCLVMVTSAVTPVLLK